MIRRILMTFTIAWLLVAARGPLAAQTATDLLATGMRAYQGLDYDEAAVILRRGLARVRGDTLSTAERLQALTYLAATELFRGRRDSAVAVFRQVAVLDPKYKPSDMIFPPQVTSVFQDVRQTTKVVFIVIPPVTEFRARTEQFTARLAASAPHNITVALSLEDGTPVRQLFAGPIGDSLAVKWDGLTEAGDPVKSGRYFLRVTSRGTSGSPPLVRQVGLDVERAGPDTLQWPSATDAGEFGVGSSGPAVRSLAGGLLAALAVVALPSVVGQNGSGFKGRFAVAAAIGGAGVAGFLVQRPGRTLEDAANTVARDAARHRLEAVRTENARRRGEARLLVRAGPSTLLEQGGL